MGVPSLFIRVSGCNLRCRWCDTPYASWYPEGDLTSIEDLVTWAVSSSVTDVVLTGGEPMLFAEMVTLSHRLAEAGKHITFETAGTVDAAVACHLMSISPKLANSTPDDPVWGPRHDATRTRPDVLRNLMARYPYQLKFVVDPAFPGDVAEIDALLAEIGPVPADRVLLMPEGTSSADVQKKGRALVDLCLERGWRLTPRYHLDLFGNQRGT